MSVQAAAASVTLTLPDGKTKVFETAPTGAELAASIGAGLAKAALAVKVDGEVRDLYRPIPQDASVAIITKDSEEALELIRHDCAHIMAEAVQSLFPGTQVTIGPAIEDGFYYDFAREEPFTPDDFPKIEAKMREIVARDARLVREEMPRDKAIALFEGMGEKYKAELIRDLPESEVISIYRQGEWFDLCRGPHLPSTGKVGTAFKVMKVAGAYWRGDSKNAVLQRIYGTAWRTKEELEAHLVRLEEAAKRDHRRLGKDLEIFMFSEEVGPGLPLWLPKGTIVRDELEFYAKLEERRDGYQRVATPQLTKEKLYYTSGHLPYYAEDMYAPIKIEEENYYLRPMNCPHHHQIFGVRPRSYREMPVRLAEYGHVYRYEASGALSGLMRTRGFCQNDAHIYCTPEQAEEEFLRVMQLHERVYKTLGIADFYMRFSLPDLNKLEKYVDDADGWRGAVEIIRRAMVRSGLPFKEVSGEAAFYGPKIDFMIKSVIGVEYAISTNQLDFVATKRFGLRYIGEDGAEHPVFVIHRAPMGSHERFVAFMLEHHAGALPLWLAPVQVRVIPISDKHLDYAHKVLAQLRSTEVPLASGTLRADMDDSNERMQKKIRQAQLEKIPYMLVVGDKEAEEGTAAVRLRSGEDLGALPLVKITEALVKECTSRSNTAELKKVA